MGKVGRIYVRITKLQQFSKSTLENVLLILEIPLNFLIWDMWEPYVIRSTGHPISNIGHALTT